MTFRLLLPYRYTGAGYGVVFGNGVGKGNAFYENQHGNGRGCMSITSSPGWCGDLLGNGKSYPDDDEDEE
jgi:hypothetical protein